MCATGNGVRSRRVTGVARIRHVEAARLDRSALERLVREHGEEGAERLVGRALECIAVLLNRVERAWRTGDAKRIWRDTIEIAAHAEEIGLSSLHRVAGDVVGCIETGDPAALGATVGRMIRLGEASLMTAWNLDG